MRACPAEPRSRRDGVEQLGELAPRGRVDGLHVDGVGPPEVVLPGDGVLEGRRQTVHLRHDLRLEAHETSIRQEGAVALGISRRRG